MVVWQGKMKRVTWWLLSSSAESYSRGLAFYITISEGMKEPHSEFVRSLWLQPGARASLKTVSCANLSGALWGRWKRAWEKTISCTLAQAGCLPPRPGWWDEGTSSPTSLQAGLPSSSRALILPLRLGMWLQPCPQASWGSAVSLTLSWVYSWWQLVLQGRKVWIWSFVVIFM